MDGRPTSDSPPSLITIKHPRKRSFGVCALRDGRRKRAWQTHGELVKEFLGGRDRILPTVGVTKVRDGWRSLPVGGRRQKKTKKKQKRHNPIGFHVREDPLTSFSSSAQFKRHGPREYSPDSDFGPLPSIYPVDPCMTGAPLCRLRRNQLGSRHI